MVAVGTTNITASYAGVENVYRPSEATYVLNVTSSEPIPGTETDPYTVAEARTFIDGLGGETSGEVYVTGIISQIDSYNDSYHSITYWISDDGTTTNQLEVYSGKGLNGANFSSVNDLIVGSTVTVKGNLKKYNDVYEFNYNSEIVSLTPPAQYTLTNVMSNVAEYFVFVGNIEIEFDNNNQAQISAGATVYVSLTMQDCYALNSLTVNGSTAGVTEVEPGVYYSFVMPEENATIAVSSTQATEYTLTVVGGENVTFDLLAGAGSIPVSLTNGTASICEQLFVTIANLTANSGLVLQSVTLTAGGSTTTLTLDNGVYHFNMPSNNATLTFTTDLAPVADNYELFSGALVEGDYIIYYDGYAMKNTVVNNRLSYETVTPSNDVISTADATIVWHIAPSGEYWTIFSADAEAYAASTGSKNQARMLSDGTSDNALWTVTGTATYEFENKARAASSSNSGNKWLRNNGTNGFACYANSTGGALSLYKKVEATETYTLTINGYTDVAEGEGTNNKGYYLIASPVTVDPATAGMTTGNFDLYYFNQAETDEWRNYENASFNLVPGTGYLYAKEGANQTFNFTLTGAPYDGDGEIELRNTTGADFEGWNLVGNPYGVEAEISMDYYEMNSDRSGLIAGEDYIIDAMQGVFVKYSEEDQTVIFMPAETGTASGGESKLALNLTKGRGVIDRAIVRFGEGRQLPKFQLNQDDTKVYITEGNQDFAVVRSNNAGEMPVSFKAAENGNYTLSVEAENVEASYLHLVDNMTGADIDLLATPSYSFEARTTDYANRFKLSFKANTGVEENATSTFAYYNGSSWTVSNMGEAILQVVDMMGRVLSSETISGNVSISLNQPAGVYMLRLVNGENVMVQKVVVR